MSKRLKILFIYEDEFFKIMQGEMRVRLPARTVLLRVQHEFSKRGFSLLLENPGWLEVPEGETVPSVIRYAEQASVVTLVVEP